MYKYSLDGYLYVQAIVDADDEYDAAVKVQQYISEQLGGKKKEIEIENSDLKKLIIKSELQDIDSYRAQ